MSIQDLSGVLNSGILDLQVPFPTTIFISPSSGLQSSYDALVVALTSYKNALVAEAVTNIPAVVTAVGALPVAAPVVTTSTT